MKTKNTAKVNSRTNARSAKNSIEKQKRVLQMPERRPKVPLPEQHQQKPGIESEIRPRPQYEAPNYKGSEKLKDKVAIVTGGDSGIGRAVAVLYAREGADVAIMYLEEVTEEQWDRTFKTNIYGYFHMCKAALPHLKAGAAIVNTGSITGLQGSKELLDYAATKGAIHAFTKSLAQNLVEKKIRVNCVAPGPVWTPLNIAVQPPEDVAQFGGDVPMRRPAQPEEIAPAYVFFASEVDSSYVTGEILTLLGGETTAA